MRTIIISLIVILVIISCAKKIEKDEARLHSFHELTQFFVDPPAEYRTIPFWVWNDEVTREKIDRDLADYKDKGFGGVFIHPRYGLITEYLSEEWFDLVKYSVEKGNELGLYVWLYDENSFPSGFAGGHVAAEMPESWNKGHALRLHKLSKLEPDPELIFKHIFIRIGDEFREITEEVSEYEGNEGDFYLYELIFFPKSKWYGGYSYVDLIYPGVTEKFIDVTMEGYERTVVGYFGNVVPGIFTDEPNIGPGGGGGLIRWTPDLYDVFMKRWGYDLKDNLHSLVEDIGDWKKIRHDYYEVLLQLFIDRWSKPWYEYTEKTGLVWTGHYWEHGWPNPHHGGDNMAMYAWHQVPGIDMLFNSWEGRPDQFGNARAVKELSSVANQFDRTRTLSETYGAAGHELTFEDMKRNGDWEYVLGVNLMNQHLSFMTIMGDRKHDFPQTFSYHVPWWDVYSYQADYFGRLSMALSSGKQINHTLVIEPTSTAWMYYNPTARNEEMYALGNEFEDFIDLLEKFQVEYDIGCENIMKDHGKIDEGKLQINHGRYDLVVLPPGLQNLENSTAQLLSDYLKQGGKILSFISAPEYIDGKATSAVAEMFDQYSGQCIASEGITEAELELLENNGLQFIQPGNAGGLLFHQRRRLSDGQLIFLVNSSLEDHSSGSFLVEAMDLAVMDPEKGSIWKYPFTKKDDHLVAHFDVPPAGGLLLFASDNKLDLPQMDSLSGEWTKLEPSAELIVNPAAENVLVLDYCDLTLEEEEMGEHYFYTASDKIFRHYGFDGNPWVSSSQFKTEILDRDTFKADQTGFRADFHFKILQGVDFDGFSLVIERPQLYSILVNEAEVQPNEDEFWLDESFGVFNIGEHLKASDNTISIIANPMSVHCELAPVFIKGNFSLESVEKGWIISPPAQLKIGSWVKQGYPFYSDIVEYTSSFQITGANTNYKVALNKWVGTVAVVEINGEEAGIIYRKPYELDISGFMNSGKNTISIKIIGSLKNLLGPHHNVEQYGIVTPWSFKYAEEEQPEGESYDLVGYGMYEEFEVFKGE